MHMRHHMLSNISDCRAPARHQSSRRTRRRSRDDAMKMFERFKPMLGAVLRLFELVAGRIGGNEYRRQVLRQVSHSRAWRTNTRTRPRDAADRLDD